MRRFSELSARFPALYLGFITGHIHVVGFLYPLECLYSMYKEFHPCRLFITGLYGSLEGEYMYLLLLYLEHYQSIPPYPTNGC